MFYDKVKKICKEKHIAIWKLEEDLGFAQGSVCKWNKVSPSIERVKKVADYLGITVDELITERV